MRYLLLILFLTGCAQAGKIENPRILLIGDSVTHGYAAKLYTMTRGLAKVSTTVENGKNSFYTSQSIERWMVLLPADMIYDQLDGVDIILWNNGLWNAMNPSAEVYGRTDTQYVNELTATAMRMKADGARVIFTLTTEIPEGAAAVGFLPAEVDRLNALAVIALLPLGIEIFDLNKVSKSAEHLAPNDVHYSDKGYETLAKAVWDYIQGEKK